MSSTASSHMLKSAIDVVVGLLDAGVTASAEEKSLLEILKQSHVTKKRSLSEQRCGGMELIQAVVEFSEFSGVLDPAFANNRETLRALSQLSRGAREFCKTSHVYNAHPAFSEDRATQCGGCVLRLRG